MKEEDRVTVFSLLYCCRDVCQELEDAWSQLEAFSTSKGKRETEKEKSNAVLKDALIFKYLFSFFP